MNRTALCLAALLTLSAPLVSRAQTAPPNAVNFQGRLATSSGNPVPDGMYSVRFRLYDVATGGSFVYEKIVASVNVKNGTFAVSLDAIPPIVFNGNLWLGVQIGTDAELTPRTQILSLPYAMKSNLALTVPDGSITNAKIVPGTLTADRFVSGFFNSTAWLLNGNSGVLSGFIGTTDFNPFEIRVNGHRAVRHQYAENTATAGSEYRSINVLGGSEINSIGAAVEGGTIAGGGYDRFTGTDLPNRIFGDFGTIGGGVGNTTNGNYAVVAGGYSSTGSADYSTVGGGYLNAAGGVVATVAGGDTNAANGSLSTVGGGFSHLASGYASTIAGGYDDTAGGNYATVAGGRSNSASVDYATVGGGYSSLASGTYSTVPGGNDNTASGSVSFAAGNRARASHAGAFVWADSTPSDFASTGVDQFLIRANGGVGINTTNPGSYDLYVNGAVRTTGSLTATTLIITNPPFGDYRNAQWNATTGEFYQDTSSRRYKRNITPLVDDFDKLLQAVPMTYTRPGKPDRWEIGFIAEEFDELGLKRLVDYAEDGKTPEGINYEKICLYLTAIARKQKDRIAAQEQKHSAEINTLKAENAELKARLDAIERALAERADKKR